MFEFCLSQKKLTSPFSFLLVQKRKWTKRKKYGPRAIRSIFWGAQRTRPAVPSGLKQLCVRKMSPKPSSHGQPERPCNGITTTETESSLTPALSPKERELDSPFLRGEEKVLPLFSPFRAAYEWRHFGLMFLCRPCLNPDGTSG